MRRALTILLTLALLNGAAAQASYEPLGSATTSLTLSRPFVALLKQNGIKVQAAAPGKRRGSRVSLPLASGKWDPTIGKGQVESDGAIVFVGGGRRLPVRQITVKANSTPLTAKVGGGQLKVATSKSTASKRAGFGSAMTAKKLLLSAKVATRLNKKLRPRIPFEAGQVLGDLAMNAQPQTMSVLPRNRVSLSLSPELMAKLDSLFVSVNPIAPAELFPGPVLSLPIAGQSTISPDGHSGTIRTGGEIELLQLGAGQLFWGAQRLDLGAGADLIEADLQPSPPYAGKQEYAPLLSLSLQGAAVSPEARTRRVGVSGVSVTLTAAAADQMNQLFADGGKAFAPGDPVGKASFTAQGQ